MEDQSVIKGKIKYKKGMLFLVSQNVTRRRKEKGREEE